jgi:UDPglucose 6-dehydrogenase
MEPGVAEALRPALASGALTVVEDGAEAVGAAPVMHLAYDTRVGSDGRHEDDRLDEAVHLFTAAAPDGALLIVSSQLVAGTCRRWRDLLDAEARGLLLAHVPENLRLGRALDDFLKPERVIVGADTDEAYERAVDVLGQASPIRVGLTAAELAKHATNAYLALCVAFANDLAWISMDAGADPEEVASAFRADPRVAPTAPLRPGPAFSGATLLRDLATLRALGEESGHGDLFAAALAANELQAGVALAWLEEALGKLRGKRIAVAGLTYKPGTSTLRDSLPLRVVSQLVDRGADVSAWDPNAEEFDEPGAVTRTASLEACVEGADALVVMTALPELTGIDWDELRPSARVVVDGCMGVERQDVEAAGWTYFGLRNGVGHPGR